jgi:hypothetical protein
LHSSDTGEKMGVQWDCISAIYRFQEGSIILTEFGTPRKLVRLIKMCSNETYSKIHIGKHLSGVCPIKNGLKQGDALSPSLFNFALEYATRNVEEN